MKTTVKKEEFPKEKADIFQHKTPKIFNLFEGWKFKWQLTLQDFGATARPEWTLNENSQNIVAIVCRGSKIFNYSVSQRIP